MDDIALSPERIEIISEAALRQLQSGRSIDTVISNLEMKGLTLEEAKNIAEKAYAKIQDDQDQKNIEVNSKLALRQLLRGRSNDVVVSNLEMQGFTRDEARNIVDEAYKKFQNTHNYDVLNEDYNEDFTKPLYGGLIGALIGGLIWGSIILLTNHSFNFMAVLVGYLSGYGTYKYSSSKNKYELTTRVIAGFCSVIGIAVGECLAFISFVYLRNNPIDVNFYFSADGELNFMKALWILMAVLVAVLKAPRIFDSEKRVS